MKLRTLTSEELVRVRDNTIVLAGVAALVAAVYPPPSAQYLGIAGALLGFNQIQQAAAKGEPADAT